MEKTSKEEIEEEVAHVKHKPKSKKFVNKPQEDYKGSSSLYREFRSNSESKKCYKCGEKFEKGHLEKCAAIGRVCYNCGKPNHLSAVCKSRKSPRKNIRYLQESESELSSDEDVFSIFEAPQERVIQVEQPRQSCIKSNLKTIENADSAVYSISKQKHKLRIIKANNTNIRVLIDSGSSATVLDRNTFDKITTKDPKIKLTTVKTKLFPYGTDTPLKILGKFTATLESNNKITITDVYRHRQTRCW